MRAPLIVAVTLAALAAPGTAGLASSPCPEPVTLGTPLADDFHGSGGPDSYDGDGGPDGIYGGGSGDCLWGGAGEDRVEGDRGDDRIYGGDGADQLEGGFGRDSIYGGAGNDRIGGGQDRNVIHAGPGDDVISSSNGVADEVDCGPGRDRVVADRGGHDHLHGCERVVFKLSPFPLVTPRSGRAGTTFTVYFRALYDAGEGRGQYVIGVVHSGPCATGYSSLGAVSKGTIGHGATVRFILRPGPHGGWCPGLFRGVAHWEGPGGSQDVRLGRFFFRVR
jgi:Ca2+-binding RTX toxin-like protein